MMKQSEKIDLIRLLSEANGVSGFEDEVADLLRSYCRDFGPVKEDSLRNLYVERSANSGQRPRVMLDAHVDEVGFIVQAILPNGLLKILPLGSWIAYHVPAHRVRVKNRDGAYIPGVIATKPPHYMSEAERNTVPSIPDMLIDIGSSSRQETEEVFGIRLAAPVVPDVPFEMLKQKNWFMGKAFDCRVGCAALVATLDKLEGEALNVDVYGTFSTQEEVGGRGVEVSTRQVKPDVCILFEGSPADDSFGPTDTMQTILGKGPMLRHFDRSMITNPRFQRFSLDAAAEAGVPFQEGVRTGGGTNAGIIHRSHNGIPCIVIGVPVRYAHTHFGLCAYADFEAAVDFAAAVLRRLDDAAIKTF